MAQVSTYWYIQKKTQNPYYGTPVYVTFPYMYKNVLFSCPSFLFHLFIGGERTRYKKYQKIKLYIRYTNKNYTS